MQQNPLKNYNIFALRGDYETTDMDVVEELGLDPAVANTPAINDAAINKMYLQNLEEYLSRGMDEKAAESLLASTVMPLLLLLRLLLRISKNSTICKRKTPTLKTSSIGV